MKNPSKKFPQGVLVALCILFSLCVVLQSCGRPSAPVTSDEAVGQVVSSAAETVPPEEEDGFFQKVKGFFTEKTANQETEQAASSKSTGSAQIGQERIPLPVSPTNVGSGAQASSAAAMTKPFLTTAPTIAPSKEPDTHPGTVPPSTSPIPSTGDGGEELRAVWISYYELSMKAQKGGTEASFRQKISGMFQSVASAGFNTIIVQVRPFSDAFYPSGVYPWSAYLTGTQGEAPGYDPLHIMTEQAHHYGLSLHAWINPYRVSSSSDISALSPSNPARKWLEDENPENDSWVVFTGGGLYYNPTVPQVRGLIVAGVKEVIEHYPVDAIHLDDYFYPSTDEKIDQKQYDAYTGSGGTRSRSDWRRENVSSMMRDLYAAVKSIDSRVLVGVSPAGDVARNRNSLYADVEKWGSQKGYVDYLMPQLYYGFENSSKPFEKTARQWASIVTNSRVQLFAGLAIYKSGKEDVWAGKESDKQDTPRYEWMRRHDLIARQVELLRSIPSYSGFALFSYRYTFGGNCSGSVKQEMQNLYDIL